MAQLQKFWDKAGDSDGLCDLAHKWGKGSGCASSTCSADAGRGYFIFIVQQTYFELF